MYNIIKKITNEMRHRPILVFDVTLNRITRACPDNQITHNITLPIRINISSSHTDLVQLIASLTNLPFPPPITREMWCISVYHNIRQYK